MASSKGIKRLQVPNSLIMNKEVPHNAFALYVELKNVTYNDVARIYPATLKMRLNWNDNRKLKRHLEILFEQGLIYTKVDRINPYRELEIDIKPIAKQGEGFTQVDINTINAIKTSASAVDVSGKKGLVDIWEIALRLFYYYEMRYNRNWGKACPSYERIYEDTGINFNYIKGINTVFHENNLVNVKVGAWSNVELEDTIIIRREVNAYIPNCSR